MKDREEALEEKKEMHKAGGGVFHREVGWKRTSYKFQDKNRNKDKEKET